MAKIDFFGKERKRIWQQFADEVNGTFVEGKWWQHHRIEIPHDIWTIYLDTHTVSNGQSSATYTRVYAPYRINENFQFTIYQRNLFADIGKAFGMQDVEVGYQQFDKKFIIKGNDSRYLRDFFEEEPIRGILMLQPLMRFRTRNKFDDRVFKKAYPARVQDIYFSTVGIIKDPDWMHDLCLLISHGLDKLTDMGCALYLEPEKPNYHPKG